MKRVIVGTNIAPHGMFYMESAGGAPLETDGERETDERKPSCFSLEEENGEHWSGAGASKPLVNETRPSL